MGQPHNFSVGVFKPIKYINALDFLIAHSLVAFLRQ